MNKIDIRNHWITAEESQAAKEEKAWMASEAAWQAYVESLPGYDANKEYQDEVMAAQRKYSACEPVDLFTGKPNPKFKGGAS